MLDTQVISLHWTRSRWLGGEQESVQECALGSYDGHCWKTYYCHPVINELKCMIRSGSQKFGLNKSKPHVCDYRAVSQPRSERVYLCMYSRQQLQHVTCQCTSVSGGCINVFNLKKSQKLLITVEVRLINQAQTLNMNQLM